MEEIGVDGVKTLRKLLKFGDVVVNHWASERNPSRTGVFVAFKDKTILVTDMKGEFWQPILDHRSKIEIIGTVLSKIK